MKTVDVQKIIRGTLIERYLYCRLKDCDCRKKKKKKHGPHYYLVCSKNRKTIHTYIPKDKVETVKLHIENYNKLWQYIDNKSEENIIKVLKRKVKKDVKK